MITMLRAQHSCARHLAASGFDRFRPRSSSNCRVALVEPAKAGWVSLVTPTFPTDGPRTVGTETYSTRRNFLRTTAWSGAALLAGACSGVRQTVAPAAPPRANRLFFVSAGKTCVIHS